MSIELYPSVAKIKRNGVYENLPGFVPETGSVATQQMIATAESSNVAQYVHNSGDYFRLNDTLYQAIVKINVGDSIVVGTNCEVAVIGNDITNISKSIADYELGIATAAHLVGEYFLVNETLYVATAQIAVGDSLSTSTNCKVAIIGDELTTINDELKYGTIAENDRNNFVNLGGLNGNYPRYVLDGFTVKRTNNLFFINGTTVSTNTRWAITGTVNDFNGSSPTYARVPNWYVNNLNFVVGHRYKVHVKLLTGTITPLEETNDGTPFLTWRTTDQSLNLSKSDGYIWDCADVANMVCFVTRKAIYNNCVWEFGFEDLTATAEEFTSNSGVYNYNYPAYFDSQMSTAITKINTDINSNKTEGTYGTDIESFVFITDVHWNANKQHSPALIKKILESCPIKTVICGGDFIESHNDTKEGAVAEIKGFTDAIVGIPCYEYLAVWGNHDSNSNGNVDNSTQFTKEEEFNIMYAPFSDNSNVHWIWDENTDIYVDTKIKNDYYVDHARTRTRFLCIDWNHPYSTARTEWIQSVLAKNDGFRVVVIYHGIYKVENSELTPEHYQIMSILEPYKAKIVAVFTGHAHVDDVVDYYEDGSVPVILTSCDKFSETAGAVADTVNEQCFDVAVIDYGQSKIELTRIGRGSNRTVNISMT